MRILAEKAPRPASDLGHSLAGGDAHRDPELEDAVLPTHQVNALYMGPGRYHSTDFIKAGAGLSLVFLVVMLAALYLLY